MNRYRTLLLGCCLISFISCDDGPIGGDTTPEPVTPIVMIQIPGGIDTLRFSMTEITIGQYEEVMGVQRSGSRGSTNRPIDSINWFEAALFCNLLSIKEGKVAVYYQNRKIVD